jgi:two-component system cell cycle sensor histidine kinase/response regulator CckA
MASPAERLQQVVLVVDDDLVVRALVVRILRTAGYQVFEAGDGAQAWTHFQRQPTVIDILVADVVMPRMTGTELAARVHTLRPELPVLLMSGYTPTDLLARGLQAEHASLVTKPFNGDALVAAVRKALRA